MSLLFEPHHIDRIIRKNLDKLRKPGVFTVRPGFEIAGNQLTGKQAIVATVHTKRNKADLSRKDLLPEKIGRFPVDVREATAYQRLRAQDPAAAALAQVTGLQAEQDPAWPNEREISSGKTLDDPSSDMQRTFKQSKKTQPATHRALESIQKKKQIVYAPPNGAPPLERVQVTTDITATVSPDAGYATLSNFLADTQQSLVIGMYDFTSGPLLKDFLGDLGGNKKLQMVLDNPAPNPTRDQIDWVTVQELQSGLGQRASIAWALDRSDSFAAAWMFPYAYHIKVIVQDGDTFWLSSGNLNNSNEPDLSRPPHTEDRDWHVIIANKELAQTFTFYLNYDYTSAAANQSSNADEVEKAIQDAHAKKQAQANPPPARPAPSSKAAVAAQTFKKANVAITPLLTPDKLPNGEPQYLTNIINLIKSAQKSVYIQLQYIEASKGDGSAYEKLLQAIADQAAAGKDVKLIESAEYGVKWAEAMKAQGVDLTSNIGLQDNVHNKGFVIDSKTVVVSSQNFSPAGVQDNRDAGVIIESPDIAQYFEKVFLADWNTKTKPAAAPPAALPKRAAGRIPGKREAARPRKRVA
jgi:phosphatidylserine/phosphatidylglycerophosphate/cardiolipin synthase-like enzyme